MEIQIFPNDPLIDEKVYISISGLEPHQKVTVKTSVTEVKSRFSSSACFTSDLDGNIHIDRQPSLMGTYTGIDCMGLFWSMIPDPGQQKGQRYIKRDVSTQQVVDLTVFNGHHSWNDCHTLKLELLASKQLQRWFLHKSVKREEVRNGKLRGTLFIPPGQGPFLGVIDIFGTAGGLIEFRASLLASRGFITYALPYINFDDLPKDVLETDFDYLKNAVGWFSSHKLVNTGGIGITGVSKGGELALMLATKCSQVKAVVNINGTPFCSYGPLGPFTDFVESDPNGFVNTDDGVDITNATYNNFKPEKLLKTWETDVNILYIVGEDDKAVSPKYAEILYNCYPENKRHNLIIKRYRNAGHLIEPPYLPVCTSSYHKVYDMIFLWGGHVVYHAKAQEDSWQTILNFFQASLTTNKPRHCLSSHL